MRRHPSLRGFANGQRVHRTNQNRKPMLESLESRFLMTVAPPTDCGDLSLFSGHPAGCTCPICTGVGLDNIPVIQATDPGPAASSPLSSLPQLSSRPGATAKLVLDFDGNTLASWGGYTNVITPAYDQDGDPTTFSAGELASINEIWARVSEDYAPFNIDVTTIDPGVLTDKVVAKIAIGGNYSDWYGSSAGGVAYVGGFYNFASNVGFVFKDALGNGNPKYVAEAAAHEAGHLFGLQHQAAWSGTTLVSAYSQGDANWAPIMGVGYYSNRTTWFNGPTPSGPTSYEDELAILSGSNDGFGYRADDYGSSIATASSLPISGGSVNVAGLIGQYTDADYFQFTTTGGTLNLQLNVAQFGANLDSVLELQDGSGTVIASSAPTNSLGSSLSLTVGAGTYYLVARGMGDYGDMGQYTITGTIAASSTAPEISVSVGGVNVADGGSVAFGSVNVGSPVTKTFTVKNDGTATLNLTAINGASLPAGFSLVSNVGVTSLAPGQSTTFSVGLTAATAGSFSGSFQLFSDDANESPFDISLSGTVVAPEISVSVDGVNLSDGGSVAFGSVNVGSPVTKTFTVKNDGTSTLTLTTINGASLPAGFSLVSNLGTTSLAPGQSTTFSVRLTATAVGSFGGSFQLLSNDSDESPFDISLAGTVMAPEITVSVGGVNVADGGSVSFGSANLGSPVTKTFTVTNDGTATLTLTAINAAGLPAGFSLVSNLGVTSLAPGQSTTFSVTMTAAAVGSFGGSFQLLNNDADEGTFDISLSGTVVAPEITLRLGSTNLTDGQSVSFGSTTPGTSVTRTFTVVNDGTASLTLTALNPAAFATGFSLVTNLGATTLAAGQSTTFTIRFDPQSSGTFNCSLSLLNNDANENPFDLSLSGSCTAAAPDIAVLAVDQTLVSGGSFSFGTTPQGTSLQQTFTVRNDGTGVLTLTPIDPASLPTGFTLVSNLGATTLNGGESTTFTIQLDAAAGGSFSGQLVLVSSDPDEGSFAIGLTGDVVAAPPPVVQTIDDGGAGNQVGARWKSISGKGYANDFHTANKGNGAVNTTWSFGNLPDGTYRVWTTWVASGSNATNSPFTLFAGNQAVKTIKINQRVAPSGLSADGSSWKLLGTVTVAGGQLSVKLTNAANGTVMADAVRVERVLDAAAPIPEIGIQIGSYSMTSGNTINLGINELNASASATFTITNHGNATLCLQQIDPATLPAGFHLVENLGATLLLPGESTTFTVEVDTAAVGDYSGAFQILSSDGDEAAFTINLKATVFDPSQVLVRQLDNGDAGTSVTSGWTRTTGKGVAKDLQSTSAGNGSRVATWSFTGLPSGEYKVFGTWVAASVNANNAQYQIASGGQTLSSIRVNQRIAPAGHPAGGIAWKLLGTVTITGSEVTVKLNNLANGTVVADAIRLERTPAGVDAMTLPSDNQPTWLTSGAAYHSLTSTANSAVPQNFSQPSDYQAELDLLESTLSLLAWSRQKIALNAGSELADAALRSLLTE